MSQFQWFAQGYEVLTGYDRPMNWWFLVIDYAAEEQCGDEPIYSNLNDHEGPGLTIQQIQERLASFGLPIPRSLVTDLQEDRALQRMNHRHTYTAADWE